MQLNVIVLTPRGAGYFYYVVGRGGADSAPPITYIENGSKSSQ